MNDTSPEMQAIYNGMMAARTPEERLNMMGSMYDCAKQLATAGILHQHPTITPAQLRIELFRRFYQNDFSPDQFERILEALQRNAQ